MKILHVIPSYIPAYRHGGPVKAVHELCRTLAQKGVDVSVFTTNTDYEGNLDVPVNKLQNIEGVKVFYYPVKFLRPYYYSGDLTRAIKKHVREFDMVHIHAIYLYPTFIAASECRKRNIPYIINPFGALDIDMIKLKGFLRKSLYLGLIERRNINGARAVDATSLYEKERIESLGFKTPISVVPRGVDLKAYERPREGDSLIKKYPKLENKKVVLFLGRIHPKKGLDLLSVAFRRVIRERKDVYLVIAGPSEEGYAERIKKLCGKIGIMDEVLFTGMLLEDEKLAAFYSSDIFVLPSYGENFGIAVLEAMACRVPVIITNRVGLYPDVEEYKAGIVTDCSSDQIAEAILKLLDNGDLRKNMGENGKRLVEDRFTLDKVVDKMIDVYNTILEREERIDKCSTIKFMNDTIKSHNYCYKDNKPSCAHAYLWPFLLKSLPKNKGLNILDHGCGDGSFTHLIAQRGHKVVGIDCSESGIELARENFPECNFIKANIYDLPHERLRNSFDIVFSLEVVEHLFYPRELMKVAKQCLKSKGLFILTTPYHGYLKNLIIAILGKTDTHFGSTIDGGHIKFFSKNTIYDLLKETGFKPIKFYGSGRFLFLWKSMVIVAQKI